MNADSLYNGNDYALRLNYLFTDTSKDEDNHTIFAEVESKESILRSVSVTGINGDTSHVVLISVNGGRNFKELNRIKCSESLTRFDFSDGGRCLVFFFERSIFYSLDSGASFEQLEINSDKPFYDENSFFDWRSKFFFLSYNKNAIICFVGSGRPVIDTVNFGDFIGSAALFRDTLKVFTHGRKIYKSSDWGRHWIVDSFRLYPGNIKTGISTPGDNRLSIMSYVFDGPDFRNSIYSKDFGNNWRIINNVLSPIVLRNESMSFFYNFSDQGRFYFQKDGDGKLCTYYNPELYLLSDKVSTLILGKSINKYNNCPVTEIYHAEMVPADHYTQTEAYRIWEQKDSLYFGVKIKKGKYFDGNIHCTLLGGQAFDYRKKLLSEKFYPLNNDSTEWGAAFSKDSVGISAGIKDYKLELTYRDSGKENNYQLGTFHYNPDQLWQRKGFITTIVFVALILIFLLTQLSKQSAPLFSKWFPVTLWFLSTGATTITGFLTTSLKDYIDTGLLLIYLLISIPVLLAAGIVRPSFFKSIAGIAPFHLLAPLVSVWPYFRKRYYAEYINNLAEKLGTEKMGRLLVQGSSPVIENYTPVPALFFPKGSEQQMHMQPVAELIHYVDPENEACCHIIIVAPGGQGKSALLREFLGQYLQFFRNNPTLPLPVYLNGSGREISDIQELIKHQLGRFLLSEELFGQEMKGGRYFLIIDGLSEAIVKPGALANFVAFQNEAGVHTPVIITTRPNKVIENEMRQSALWVEVRPQKLDDETVKAFEQAYLGDGKQLAEHVRRICRSSNGEYLPILIKLAVIANKERIDDISALYQKAAEMLLKSEERGDYIEVLDSIASLCGATYAQTGSREIWKTAGNKELIDMLASCGLLLPITNNDTLQVAPRTYRFFHDSIQTYFTACWFLKPELLQPDKVRALFRDFVIKDIYQKDKADIIFRNGSELFQMAVLTFQRHGVKVAELFIKELQQLPAQYKTKYSVENVVTATSVPFAANVDGTALTNMQEALAAVQSELYLLSELYHNFILLIADPLSRELPQ